jgi:type 1 glutamine amidotransferase
MACELPSWVIPDKRPNPRVNTANLRTVFSDCASENHLLSKIYRRPLVAQQCFTRFPKYVTIGDRGATRPLPYNGAVFLTNKEMEVQYQTNSYPLGRKSILVALCFVATLLNCHLLLAQEAHAKFRVIAIAEKGGIHQPFVDAAKVWLAREGAADGFSVDYIEDTKPINEEFLSHYQLFLQLNYPPYAWTPAAMTAFQNAIERGTIGWLGFHHATLLGEFDGFPMWPWFSNFMGGIRWKAYIASFSSGNVVVEDPAHPVMKGLDSSFKIEDEEWYTYDRSPRPNVHVLASVDEKSYSPDSKIKMGDHPVVWTNASVKARNVYIFMGHHPELLHNAAYTRLIHNSILWAAGQ